jgi:hypothetical protein
MSQDKLNSALRQFYEDTVRNAPTEHPERTPQCLPIPRFSRSKQTRWSEEDRTHVAGCPLCRKTLVFHWELESPLWNVAQFVAGVFPQREAMQLYFDRNPEARRLQDSIFVRKLAAAIRAVKHLSGAVAPLSGPFASEDWFGLNRPALGMSRGVALGESEPPVEELSGVKRCAESLAVCISDESSSSELSFYLADRPLTITVSAKDDELEIGAISPRIEYAANRVVVEILPEQGEPIRADLTMKEDREADQVTASARITMGNASQRLRGSVLVAGWVF